jgi:DNA-binding NtrC family response regulator
LLRIIQDGSLYRLGGHHPVLVDIRVIAATHRDLPSLVKESRFREDLWFRLNVFPIHLPPLRERKQDIPGLVDYFLVRKAREMHLPFVPRLEKGAMDRLTSYDWPGNIRELENIIERNLITCRGNPLTFADLTKVSASVRNAFPKNEVVASLDEVVVNHIKKALAATDGKISGPSGAAELLGIHPSTLRGKLRRYGIYI